MFAQDSIRNSIVNIIKVVGVDLSTRIHCLVAAINHIHILLTLSEGKIVSLPRFIATVKVRITQFLQHGWINPPLQKPASAKIWQRSYYEHIIRDEKDFQQKAKYIEEHPLKEAGTEFAEWH